MNFELYKHKNNIYVLNQTTLLHYNLKSKQLKEKISDSDSIKLYKLIGYFLNLNIKEEIKTHILQQTNINFRAKNNFDIFDEMNVCSPLLINK